ncbi:MAG: hypothetical protein AAGJ86_08910 [Pseudomonadota bacterium]
MAATLEDPAYTSVRARLDSGKPRSTISDTVRRLLTDGDLYHFDVAVRPLVAFATGSVISVENTHLPIQWPDSLYRLHVIGGTRAAGDGVSLTCTLSCIKPSAYKRDRQLGNYTAHGAEVFAYPLDSPAARRTSNI